MTTQPRFSTLFVVGLGHSGSTLLGRMLNMHPLALCVGEILRLDQALADTRAICFCREPVRTCSFWTRWVRQLPDAVKKDPPRWTLDLLDRMRVEEGRKLLVDLSKSRAWRLTRRWKQDSIGYLFLVRDPRGVMRSALKRNQDLSDLIKLHRKWIPRYQSFIEGKGANGATVFYEDLVASPEQTLRSVCEFAGLNFVPEMLSPDTKTHHLVKSSGSKFLKGANKLQQDERWREELTPRQLETINDRLSSVALYRDRYNLIGKPPSVRRRIAGLFGR